MEEVGYAQPAHLPNGRAFGLSEQDDDTYVDVRSSDAPASPASSGELDEFGPVSSMMRRAMGEQIAEQRMIREALHEFDRRVEILERATGDRLFEMERDMAARIEHFEHSFTERMAAFEAVLKRVVDRLGTSEERLIAGLDHNDRIMRAQLDAIRPAFEGMVDRVVEWVEELEAANITRQAELRASLEGAVEGAVQQSIGEPLAEALEEMRTSLGITERRVRRDVNRLTHLIRGEEECASAPDGVAAREPAIDAQLVGEPDARPRRPRPLRARPSSDPELLGD